MLVTTEEVEDYKKGTKPTKVVAAPDINLLKEQLFFTLEKTKKDYSEGVFKNYTEYTVTTKSTLTNVKEAIEFNNFHEGIHLGYVLALKRLI
jgi:beta-xylosidase